MMDDYDDCDCCSCGCDDDDDCGCGQVADVTTDKEDAGEDEEA